MNTSKIKPNLNLPHAQAPPEEALRQRQKTKNHKEET